MSDHHLDLVGLKCPLPALRTRAALLRLPAGARLVVQCSDPLASIDVPNAAREAGAAVEGCTRTPDLVTVTLRKM